MSTAAPDTLLKCSLGAPDCDRIAEIQALRAKVLALSELVVTDELTGLFNYRHLMHALNLEIERTHRSGQGFALVILDFDNFKNLNDEHGHEFGNLVLKAAGTFLRHSLRKLDVPCRFGGEEFVLVLPGSTLPEAVQTAERIRSGIAALSFSSADGVAVPVTVSLGVDFFCVADNLTAEQMIDRVDKFLLMAKHSGKNKVCHPELSDKSEGVTDLERSALLDGFSSQTD
jgi:diguanylate cyclase (GGDEF)-like protein